MEEPAEETPNVYAGGQIARESSLGVLGKRDFMDVPFNVTSFSNQLIENQQASSVVDVIVNDPSVSNLTLSSVSQAWMIRGFKAQQQDTQINGLYGVAPRFYGGIEYVDHVEVLKGPGALLYEARGEGAKDERHHVLWSEEPVYPAHRYWPPFG